MTTIKHAQFKKWWIDEDDDDIRMITTTLIIFLLNKKYNEDIEDFIIDADEDEKINILKNWFVETVRCHICQFAFVFYSSWVPRLTDGFIHTPVLYMFIFTKHEEAIWFDLPESLRFCWEKFTHYDSNLSFSISDAFHFILIYLYRFALRFVS